MKKTLAFLLAITIFSTTLLLYSCTEVNDPPVENDPPTENDQTSGSNVPPPNNNDENNVSEIPLTFLNREAFYRFAQGDRTINPSDFLVGTYWWINSYGFNFVAPLIRLEDILPDAVEQFRSVEVGVDWYLYELDCGITISVNYQPNLSGSAFEMGRYFDNRASSSFVLRDGNVEVSIRRPGFIHRPPLSSDMFTEEEIEFLTQREAEQDQEIQNNITAIFTDPAYFPITAVFMFDQAWVESAVETLDFMTEELATQLQAEISEAARTNVPSPADALLENIRSNMVWPR